MMDDAVYFIAISNSTAVSANHITVLLFAITAVEIFNIAQP